MVNSERLNKKLLQKDLIKDYLEKAYKQPMTNPHDDKDDIFKEIDRMKIMALTMKLQILSKMSKTTRNSFKL